jgi:hypothetical protein
MWRNRAAVALTLIAVAMACGTRTVKSEAERTVSDPARGIRYTIPSGWKDLDAEIRSPDGSLLTVRVYDLVDAEKKFVAGLPDTLIPQLTDWAKYYYIVDSGYTRAVTAVAGLPATEFNYTVRVRASDPPSKVTYWVVRRETRLFVLRAAYAQKALADDEPKMRGIVTTWGFLAEPPANP